MASVLPVSSVNGSSRFPTVSGEDLSNPTATWYNLTISRRHHKCSPFERPFHELNGVCRHGCHHCGVENIPAAHEIARHVPVVATVSFDRHDVRPRRWALPTLAKTKFGHAVFPSLANTIYFCFEGRVGGRFGWEVVQIGGTKSGAPKGRLRWAPQVGPSVGAFFFPPSPTPISTLSSLSWGPSRGILLAFSGCRVKPRRLRGITARGQVFCVFLCFYLVCFLFCFSFSCVGISPHNLLFFLLVCLCVSCLFSLCLRTLLSSICSYQCDN